MVTVGVDGLIFIARACFLPQATLFFSSNPLTPSVAIRVQLSTERQSAGISRITNDNLTQSGTGCIIAVPIWQQWASNG